MKARRYLVTIHLWLGLTIGAFWALQGLTGALLVFNRDIQPLFLGRPQIESRSMLPLDDLFARAAEAAGAKITHIENFTPDPSLLVAYYKDAAGEAKTVVIDGGSGAALETRYVEPSVPGGGSTWKWLLLLHEKLLAGPTGLMIVGSSGILLLSSLILGFIIAWPRRRAWKPVYAVGRWRTGAQRLFGWHRMLGLTLGAVLLISATCGIYLAFSDTIRPWLAATVGYKPAFKPKPVDTLAPPRITAQQALDSARSRFPDAVVVRATLPTEKSPLYTFRLLQKDENRRWAGTTTAAIDPGTGKIVNSYDPLNAPLANRIADGVYPTHTGEIGGPLMRILIMLGGLALPTLYITGVLAWLGRRRRRAANASTRIAPAQAT